MFNQPELRMEVGLTGHTFEELKTLAADLRKEGNVDAAGKLEAALEEINNAERRIHTVLDGIFAELDGDD